MPADGVMVVGAGISGLAAAYELQAAPSDVRVLEAHAPGAGQSAGPGRIFRIAHPDPRLCALALEARERWRLGERDLGAAACWAKKASVVGEEPPQGAAMCAAGAPFEPWTSHIQPASPSSSADHP